VSAPDLAVFDLDGTLTRKDTFLPFLAFLAGRGGAAFALAAASPALVRCAIDRSRRDEAKERLVRLTLRGRTVTDVGEAGATYAADVEATQLRPDMLARLRWHQAQGHDCVIVSASLEVYVEPLARRLGVSQAVSTRLEADAQGALTGRLLGTNCRGAEKLGRLAELFGPRAIAWAYGDSVDDQALLDRAAHPLLVGKAPVAAVGAA
jgi:phosphatidylglycerophosphatase C